MLNCEGRRKARRRQMWKWITHHKNLQLQLDNFFSNFKWQSMCSFTLFVTPDWSTQHQSYLMMGPEVPSHKQQSQLCSAKHKYPFWVKCNNEIAQLWVLCHVNTLQVSRHPWIRITWTHEEYVFINVKKGRGEEGHSVVADLYHNFIHVPILLDRLCATMTVTFRSLSKRNKQS